MRSGARVLLGLVAVAFALLLPAACSWAASSDGGNAPLNPQFLAWRADRHGAGTAATAGARLGMVSAGLADPGLTPSPVDPAVFAGRAVAPKSVAYPSSYDLRRLGRVSPVRDQLPFGTCWAFAAVSSLESAMLPADAQDFSEDNVVLNAGFDTGVDSAYDHGGTFTMSTAYFARWAGPVLESQDPYGDGSSPPGLSAVRHVQEVLYIPGGAGGTDTANIKYALMTYGAVASELNMERKYLREANSAYYCYGGDYVNHAVAIVGWDDAYSAANFAAAPSGDGAWLAKNNWGAGWGQDGYFWISYYDKFAGSSKALNSVFGSVQGTDTYTDIYSHDVLGQVTTYGLGLTKMWGANAFTAHGEQSIVALGFYTPVPGSSYTLYTGSDLETLHEQGTGQIGLPGYHTVRLKSALSVHAGQRFFVAVRLVTPGTEYPLAVELYQPDYSTNATAQVSQSYVRTDTMSWTDLTDWNGSANVCLKAYAGTPDPPALEDTTAPRTDVAGADDLWHSAPVTLTFTASDGGAAVSGIAYTEYRVDGGVWVRGTSARVTADGVHTVAYRSADAAGNVEEPRTCTVRVDATGPVCSARPVTVRRGASAAVKFLVDDGLSPQVRYSVTVKSASGAVKRATGTSAWKADGVWRTWAFPCTLTRGTYQVVVRGRDLAGNAQSVIGRSALRVR